LQRRLLPHADGRTIAAMTATEDTREKIVECFIGEAAV
jgi:hypothetical protein